MWQPCLFCVNYERNKNHQIPRIISRLQLSVCCCFELSLEYEYTVFKKPHIRILTHTIMSIKIFVCYNRAHKWTPSVLIIILYYNQYYFLRINGFFFHGLFNLYRRPINFLPENQQYYYYASCCCRRTLIIIGNNILTIASRRRKHYYLTFKTNWSCLCSGKTQSKVNTIIIYPVSMREMKKLQWDWIKYK